MSRFKKLVEFVLLGDGKHGYNFPNDISKEQGKQLSDTIDADANLINLVTSQEATAKDIWSALSKTSIGAALIEANPSIVNFRISGERKGKDGLEPNAYNPQIEGDKSSTTPMHKYDVTAQARYKNQQNVPSFREFFDPSKADQYRPEEVSGAAPKETKLVPKRTI